jgi:hypothetical protein
LKKTSLRPLRQGQRLDTSETKTKLKQRAQTTERKLEQPQRAPPAHMQAPPEPMHLPLDECMQDTTWNRAAATTQPKPVRPVNTTGQTGVQHVNRINTQTGQTSDLDRSDRCKTELRNGSKPPENLLNASNKPFQAQTSPLCWQCMNQAKNAKNSTYSFSNRQNST